MRLALHLAIAAFLAAGAVCAADRSPLKGLNGDMEQIAETAKGMNKWLMRQIQKGCDFGDGPVAYTPAGWGINIGVAKFCSIDAAEVPEDRPNVHGGTASMYVAAKAPTHVQCTGCRLEPGKYRLSFWTKGTGKVHVITYNYKDTYHYAGVGGVLLSAAATDKWTRTPVVDVEIGRERPETTYSILVFLVEKGAKVYIDDLVLEAAGS